MLVLHISNHLLLTQSLVWAWVVLQDAFGLLAICHRYHLLSISGRQWVVKLGSQRCHLTVVFWQLSSDWQALPLMVCFYTDSSSFEMIRLAGWGLNHPLTWGNFNSLSDINRAVLCARFVTLRMNLSPIQYCALSLHSLARTNRYRTCHLSVLWLDCSSSIKYSLIASEYLNSWNDVFITVTVFWDYHRVWKTVVLWNRFTSYSSSFILNWITCVTTFCAPIA